MITPQEYFDKHLAWKRNESNLRTASFTYEPYSTMELPALQAEAQAGNPSAQEELGERYLFGLDHLKVDADQAISLLEQASQAGNPDAAQVLAEVYMTPEHGHLDYDRYFPLLQKAAEMGSWKAMFNLSCAYYKGQEAYDGHGFPSDKMAALKWSMRCAVLTMQLLEFYLTNPCSEDFQDYMQGVFALFVQSVSVSARQLLRGDGVPKDVDMARSLLTDSQNFYRHYFKADCSDFSMLLQHCDPQEDQ